jgi:outer membrane protein assembly factor BamB
MEDRELQGWKEIANYLGKAVRTAQRWEQDLGLPVRRIQGPTGELVTAKTSELDEWLAHQAASRQGLEEPCAPNDDDRAEPGDAVVPSPSPTQPRYRRRLIPALLVSAVVLIPAAVIAIVWSRSTPASSAANVVSSLNTGAEIDEERRPSPPPTKTEAEVPVVLDTGPWPTSGHDSRRTNQSQARGPASPATPRLIATARPGGSFGDVIATADGKVIFGDCGAMFATDIKGKRLWTFPLTWSGGTELLIGATATVAGSVLATVTECPDVRGSIRTHLYELPLGGPPATHAVPQGSAYSSPAVGPDRSVYTVDESTFVRAYESWLSEKWATDLPGFGNKGIAIAPNGVLYIGSDGGRFHQKSLTALNADGDTLWSKLKDDLGRPAIGADGTVYAAGRSGILWAFRPDGSMKWKTAVGQISSLTPLAIGKSGTIYVKGLMNLVAVSPDGKIKWPYGNATSNSDISAPVLDRDENIYAEFGDAICSVTPEGKERWCAPIKKPAPIIVAGDGLLIAVSDARELYVIGEAPAKK